MIVVRAWTEGDRSLVRARVTYSADLSTEEQAVVAAGDEESILRIVRAWLAEVTGSR